MRLLFLPKEGLDLYRTLFDSETSRRVLRFYHPCRSPFGVGVTVATLSSGLSLVSELRWYVRRYVSGVLFEIGPGRFASLALASQVYYGRDLRPAEPWEARYLLVAREGTVERIGGEPGSGLEEYASRCEGAEEVIEVWDLPARDGPSPGPDVPSGGDPPSSAGAP
ncbi:MAG TPA: DUF5804 family protein [Methanoregulaceae archaeon]|mgnify:CR=1 FL=1|nr:DUF5804 family protein [Methanoregulaceae archaeon]HQJ87882.1 DUF5804 family protein [Methanoregulaceae archaeon]